MKLSNEASSMYLYQEEYLPHLLGCCYDSNIFVLLVILELVVKSDVEVLRRGLEKRK